MCVYICPISRLFSVPSTIPLEQSISTVLTLIEERRTETLCLTSVVVVVLSRAGAEPPSGGIWFSSKDGRAIRAAV